MFFWTQTKASRAKLTAANWKVWDSFSWRFFFVFLCGGSRFVRLNL